jgi:hypothetical protein
VGVRFDSELKSLTDYLDSLSSESAVLIDVDETIVVSCEQVAGGRQLSLGSSAWFYAFIDELLKRGLDMNSAMQDTVNAFCLLQAALTLSLVENELAENGVAKIVNAFESALQRGVKIIAITLRDQSLMQVTQAQCNNLGIRFSPINNNTSFRFARDDVFTTGEVAYADGIIYCAGNNKGQVLKKIFLGGYADDLLATSKQIAFIDDSKNNCEHVADVFKDQAESLPAIKILHYPKVKREFLPYHAKTERDKSIIDDLEQAAVNDEDVTEVKQARIF